MAIPVSATAASRPAVRPRTPASSTIALAPSREMSAETRTARATGERGDPAPTESPDAPFGLESPVAPRGTEEAPAADP